MERRAAQHSSRLAIALVVAVASVAAACTSAPTLAPGQVPIGRHGGGSSADVVDSFGPGVPFGWGVILENTTGSAVAIDGYELVDRSHGLEVLGAGLLPTAPNPIGYGLRPADGDLQAAVAAHPVAGALFSSSSDPGWIDGGWLEFILRASAVGDYTVSGVRIQYHVAGSSFVTTIPATLEVCAGATLDPGEACPFASSLPG